MSFSLRGSDKSAFEEVYNILFVPSDNESAKQREQDKGFFGVCGPSTIAVLTHRSVKEVIDLWEGGYKGYGPLKELKQTLENMGYKVQRVKGNKAKIFPIPATNTAIIRIQWLKPDGTEFYWAAQTPNTHWVIMQKIGNEWWVFCNATGWFQEGSRFAKDYLKLGYVSSYLEVSPVTEVVSHGD